VSFVGRLDTRIDVPADFCHERRRGTLVTADEATGLPVRGGLDRRTETAPGRRKRPELTSVDARFALFSDGRRTLGINGTQASVIWAG
jgi:hypothetical protein